MAVNLASKYSTVVDEKFRTGNVTDRAINRDYEWSGVNAVTVYAIPTAAMGDYTRSGSNRYGNPAELQDTIQTMTVTKDRAFTFTIDRGNFDDQMMVKRSGEALARQIDEVVIPEIDKYRMSVMATAATGGNALTVTLAKAYDGMLSAGVVLDEAAVPTEGRIAFVTPDFYKALKQDASFVTANEIAQGMLIRGQVGEVDGVAIVKVPSTYFPSKCKFILTHPIATVGVEKLAEYVTHDNPPGISGWLVEGRVRYDAFVLNNKKAAIATGSIV